MKPTEIAKLSGYSLDIIYKAIYRGEIETTLVKRGRRNCIDIDEKYVEYMRQRKAENKSKNKMPKVKKERPKKEEKTISKNEHLLSAVEKLTKYNQANNTDLSYGYATAMGII